MYSRALITSDLLRLKSRGSEWISSTCPNIRWLAHLLRPALSACGLRPETLTWDERIGASSDHYFDGAAVYDRLGLDIHPVSWAGLVNAERAPQAFVDALSSAVDDALVIGYELPPVMIDALRQLNRPYVDVVLHPWRFMPDLVFALRSNVPAIQSALANFRLDEAAAKQQASLILAKSEWMSKFNMPPGTVLVLGQVPDDRAVVSAEGRYNSLQDHMAALHRLCADHPMVLFKPHPYAGKVCASAKAVAHLPAIQSVSHNFYHLLCQPELDKVVALNSSGLIEAQVFGKRSQNLTPFL